MTIIRAADNKFPYDVYMTEKDDVTYKLYLKDLSAELGAGFQHLIVKRADVGPIPWSIVSSLKQELCGNVEAVEVNPANFDDSTSPEDNVRQLYVFAKGSELDLPVTPITLLL